MVLTVYYASATGCRKTKKNQERIFSVLDSMGIAYQKKDITADSGVKEEMRNIVKDPTALAPQISNGDEYCGDIEKFEAAVEAEILKQFLKI